jgi:SAM-dependent methyltransferase
MGSVTPWYESITLSKNGVPFTIEYNKIISEDPRIHTYTVAEFNQNPRKFDAVLSISSFEHDGLGRYGDPLDPFGDLKAMQKCKNLLVDGGIMFLAVPIGPDTLCWNAHRIYGRIRLPLLLEGWEVIDSFGFDQTDFDNNTNKNGCHQPVFVLKPIK